VLLYTKKLAIEKASAIVNREITERLSPITHPARILSSALEVGKSVKCKASRLPERNCPIVEVFKCSISEYPQI
jgi:hypothetical protein